MISDKKNTICPIEYTANVIGGKWKLLIMYYLMAGGVKRYGELKKDIKGITHKMLSAQLKDLEGYEVINRKQYNEVPPRVEYSLSERGEKLLPALKMMYEWGREEVEKNIAGRICTEGDTFSGTKDRKQ